MRWVVFVFFNLAVERMRRTVFLRKRDVVLCLQNEILRFFCSVVLSKKNDFFEKIGFKDCVLLVCFRYFSLF